MAEPTLADYFDKMTQREYTQAVTLEWKNGYRHLYTSKTVEQKFTFIGVPASLAFFTDSIEVTDANGSTYTVSFKPEVIDCSEGTAILISDQTEVDRGDFSPHLRTLTVTRRAAFLYDNGTYERGSSATWAQSYK